MSDKPEYGNAQKMREALEETQSVIAKCMDILNEIPEECGYLGLIEDVADELCSLRDEHVQAAIAAPPRNCDVGTAEEQLERFMAFCKNYPRCLKCPCCGIVINGRCEFAWGQMPYEKEVK